MFQDFKPYSTYGNQTHAWIPAFPAAWAVTAGAGAFSEVRTRNDGLRETTVLSLSYGRVIVKSTDKLHGLVPASYATYQILEPGDIVFRPTDLQNDQRSIRVGAVEDRGIITSAYIGLRPRGIDPQFAFLYLRALDYMKVFYGMGSGLRQNIDFRDFKRLPVPVPPVDEQRAIVTYLAHAHQRINKAIATKRRMLSLLGEQEEAIVRGAVGRGPQGGALRDSALSWLGPVPEGWGVVALRYLARLGNGSTPSRANSAYWTGGSYPWLNSSVVNQGIVRRADQFVTDRALAECHLPIVSPGSVLVGITGQGRTRGMAALLEFEATISQHLAYMTPVPEKLQSDYLVLVLKAAYTELRRISSDSGSTKGALTVADLKAFRIPLPPLDEQHSIVMDAEQQVAKTQSLVSRVEQEIQLLEEFRNRLTADIVTGQVDVRAIAATLPPIDLPDLFAMSADTGDADDDETADGADMEDA